MALLELINTYFIQPFNATYEYNLVNTTGYALFAFIGLMLFLKLIEAKKQPLNFKFLVSLIPYILLGSLIRSYVDNSIISKTFFSVSPGLYLSVSAIFVIGLLFGKVLLLGSLSLAAFFLKFGLPNIQNISYLIFIVAILSFFIILSIYIAKKTNQNWLLKKTNLAAYSAQAFDAINTAFLLTFFGGFEKHVLPRYIIEKTGTPFSFIPLKLLIIVPILYFLAKDKENNLSKLIIIAIFVLGLAQGLRNLISVIL